MPYKFHESRRHKFPKARYRVTNWPEYDAALMRRGSLTWTCPAFVDGWVFGFTIADRRASGPPVFRSLRRQLFRMVEWPRAAAVKDRRRRPPKAARSVLDGREHGGRLVIVGNDDHCMMPSFVVDR